MDILAETVFLSGEDHSGPKRIPWRAQALDKRTRVMWHHWMDEFLNLVTGNSRYVRYAARTHWLALLAILVLIAGIPLLLYWLS